MRALAVLALTVLCAQTAGGEAGRERPAAAPVASTPVALPPAPSPVALPPAPSPVALPPGPSPVALPPGPSLVAGLPTPQAGYPPLPAMERLAGRAAPADL